MKKTKQNGELLSITEAARRLGVTRQAIYIAISLNRLKASKNAEGVWTLALADLKEYCDNRFSRAKSTFKGELLYDNDKGFYSTAQTAEILGVKAQKIYYEAKIGRLKSTRKGPAYVFHIDDIESFRVTLAS